MELLQNYVHGWAVAAGLLLAPISSFGFFTQYIEAENYATQTGQNKVSTEYFPYIGDGYLELGSSGDAVSWEIQVPKAGKYTLIFKYANNTESDLSCDLKVNEIFQKNIPFGPFTKNWKVHWEAATEYTPQKVGWAKYWNARVIVDLNEGFNKIELLSKSENGGPHIDNIGISSDAHSEPPGKLYKVRDYGAIGDGEADDSQAIRQAIEACEPGGTVVFDPGIYMTGSVTLKGNMTLWISEGATIRAFQDNSKFPNFSGGMFRKYFVFGNQVDNLTITGGGEIDGNSVGELWNSVKEPNRPVLLGFSNSQNVKITNVDLLNSGFWTLVPEKSDSVIIDGINLLSIHGHNKDGIDPLDCHDTYVTNSTVTCMDDALCPKSRSNKGLNNLVMKNITVNSTRWKGIKFGTHTTGDFTNSLFEDIAFVHTHGGIAILSVDGANVKNIRFNRIKMNNLQTPVFLLNGAGVRENIPGGSTMEDIYLSNIEARNVFDNTGSAILGTKVGNSTHVVKNVYFHNVLVEDFRGGVSEVPDHPHEYDGIYPETYMFGDFPAWGYYIRHAENVIFTNVEHSVSPQDARQAIVEENVIGFQAVGVSDSPYKGPVNNTVLRIWEKGESLHQSFGKSYKLYNYKGSQLGVENAHHWGQKIGIANEK